MFKIDYRHLKLNLSRKKTFDYRYLVNKNQGCLGNAKRAQVLPLRLKVRKNTY